ncbi:aminotransferase class III-fold pyridoxal phosphate-dependent enzyme, partial [Priestia megaterium]
SIIGDIRGLGLMIGIEIVNPDTGEGDGDALFEILDLALEKGVLFYFCGNASEVIRMVPPLTVTKEQIDDGIHMLDEAITSFEKKSAVKA